MADPSRAAEATLDFTGERVIPGRVDPNLFNEHMARYRFARQFSRPGAMVLDAGCGAGYGAAGFAGATVVGIDIAPEAVDGARARYGAADVLFVQASCESIPLADASFDLVVAFEVIEHLPRWRDLLTEARRVLKPSGVLLVSTPNKPVYAESRRDSGPNPFHVHEFELNEFRVELENVFGHVELWSQNHTEAITFVPATSAAGVLDLSGNEEAEKAQFFVGVCSQFPLPRIPSFAWVPEAGNLLGERERHIALLQHEVNLKSTWLDEAARSQARLHASHEELIRESEQNSLDARRAIDRLEAEIQANHAAARRSIGALEDELKRDRETAATERARVQREIANLHDEYSRRLSDLLRQRDQTSKEYEAQVADLEAELLRRLAWVKDVQQQLQDAHTEVGRVSNELHAANERVAALNSQIERISLQLSRTIDRRLRRAAKGLLNFLRGSGILRFIRNLPWLLLALLSACCAALAIGACDLLWLTAGRPRPRRDVRPARHAVSLVIPNWNGKDLLEKFLPSWLDAIRNHPGSEVLLVDNGSDDGSAEWVSANYPEVRLLALPVNLGFGGGSNAGFQAAKNDIVVLLNSDMRVEPDFVQPLLDGFTDETVFAVSCQIFLSDPAKRREETGLTEGRWEDGRLRVGHRVDPSVDTLFPCFYGGGGSCAFDRRKFLELGGFDELLAPFYLEDTDLGFLAWKRGWKVLYQPASIVWHEHRGTIGKKFSQEHIAEVLQKNYLLFTWKNIHGWGRLVGHFGATLASAMATSWGATVPGRTGPKALIRASRQIRGLCRSRWDARALSTIDDNEAFLRSRPDGFFDRFGTFEASPGRPRVLFVSPYPICPPTHGGGLFMYNAVRSLSEHCDVYLIVVVDREQQVLAQEELRGYVSSLDVCVRTPDLRPKLASIVSSAAREFHWPDLEWLIRRNTLLHRIDVLQLEYTSLGQYAAPYQHICCAVFEHDVYFQSVRRAIPWMRNGFDRIKARFEYLRAIRYELRMLPACDHIQVCTKENLDYLASFLPEIAPRLESGLRTGIDTPAYPYPGGPRIPMTMLFIGSFRHVPNMVALEWFVGEVLPLIVARVPNARLLVAGSDPPPRHALRDPSGAVELLGFVDDVQPLFNASALFVCPIRSGSGVRVKLLEAFASGIPVVSTYLGAEGLARQDGEFCALADDAAGFADRVVRLLLDPGEAAVMAARARAEVEAEWDSATQTRRLVERYREIVTRKRSAGRQAPEGTAGAASPRTT